MDAIKQPLKYYFLWFWIFFLTSSVILSPRLSENGLLKFIRIDDILFPITLITIFVFISGIHPIKKVILAFVYLYVFNLIVLIITHYSGLNSVSILEKVLPLVKNFQYLIYFGLCFVLGSKSKNFIRYQRVFISIYICFIPNFLHGLYQAVTLNFTGYYGLGILNEISPALTGAVFYFATIICSTIIYLMPKINLKAIYLWICFSAINAIFTALSGSRSAWLALFSYLLVVGIYTFKNIISSNKINKRNINITLTIVTSILLFFLILLLFRDFGLKLESLLTQVPSRYLNINLGQVQDEARVVNWSSVLSMYLEFVHQFPLLGLFGLGSGGIYEIFGQLLNAADSQLVYTIVSGGLIGTLLYLNALFKLYMFAKKYTSKSNIKLTPIFVGLFWSFMVFSVSQEVFNLSKTGGLFWISCGLILGIAYSDFNLKNQIANDI
ncbi:hypothetical protein [Anabaena sp. YBS01]|uniref:hypothetical protein n=1 Tax=Anabaena sp. YBS01 TaxID=2490939 RepID=UPI001292EDE7|nr:hypothetical protein [Anabaena sp. YBS01]QFZ14093.1 hypothetical protein EH233_19875 [Anabaena sp. YBS01]